MKMGTGSRQQCGPSTLRPYHHPCFVEVIKNILGTFVLFDSVYIPRPDSFFELKGDTIGTAILVSRIELNMIIEMFKLRIAFQPES